MSYVDAYVVPVPNEHLDAYKKLAKLSAKVWMEHGALEYREAVADDVKPGKLTSFPQAVKLKEGETVVFGYALFKSRAARDKAMKKIMADPRMTALMNDPKAQLFDGKRMFWGGFKTLVKA